MEESSPDISQILKSASRRLFVEAMLSAVTLPLLVLLLFSLTIFRFSSRQYLFFLAAMAVVVVPMFIIIALLYYYMQRRCLRYLLSWYREDRNPGSREDRAKALRLQRQISNLSYWHGLLVGMGIFLSIAIGMLAFGGLADFSLSSSLYYIILGLLLALTDFLITVFISQREMRKVMERFLTDCRDFGYSTGMSIGKRMAAFSATLLLLTLGITWLASTYEAGSLLREEQEMRGVDNVRLLALELDDIIDGGGSSRELEEAVDKLSLSGSESLAVLDTAGSIVYERRSPEIGEAAWGDLLETAAAKGEEVYSGFEQAEGKDYLLTGAVIDGEGWTVIRADITDANTRALARFSPTMILLLLIGAMTAAFLTLLMTHNIADPMKRLIKTCRRVGTGDLAVEIPVDSLDEIGELSSSYSEMLESLKGISTGLSETSSEVSEEADNIAAVSENLMGAIEELNALVQELSGQITGEVDQIRNVEETMQGVVDTISIAHSQASRSSEISVDAERLVGEGREHARESVRKINEFKDVLDQSMQAILSLGESSQKIGSIVDIIGRIADQTNLLALNAAIEAARVPEYGKGFSVVAEEVKKLAQEAAGSAQRINDLVLVIQEDAQTAISLMEKGTMGMYMGVETVDRTDQSLTSIAEIVGQMSRMAAAIAEASSREIEGSERLADSLKDMKGQVESNAASYQEIGASTEQQTQATVELTSTAEQLVEIAHRLIEMVKHFKTS
ncbi:MAG: methyl-accepting chemotaxis protein [Actinomycetota bacterium]|nr:methyl-accepting chemotaxis protein [Actinomycetota bacterium]